MNRAAQIHEALKVAQERSSIKSDEVSKKLKDEGNKLFKKGDLRSALISYNSAISYAVSKENLALGYANRSAVYIERGLYDECLLNIQWARENNYPADKIQKLNEREEKCKQLKAAQVKDPADDPWNFLKLSHPPNPKIPFIVDCLEMKVTEKYGRGIYATHDISAGDILSIEDTILHTPLQDTIFERCMNCAKTCRLNLIPCLKKGALMFCSIDCRKKIYKRMVDLEFYKGNQKQLYGEIVDAFGSHEELVEFLETVPDITKLNYSVFDFDWSDPNDPEYGINQVKCFLSFSGFRVNLKTQIPYLSNKVPRSVSKGNQCIEDLINHVMDVKAFHELSRKEHDAYVGVTFADLVNHSCVPNVHFMQVDNKAVLYATQPIKVGEQLFKSYGSQRNKKDPEMICHYLEMQLEDRQDILKEFFNINCDCRACKENLNLDKCKIVDEATDERSLKSKEALASKSLKPAIDQWKLNNEFITKHHENLLAMDVHMVKKFNLKIIEKIAYAASFDI